MENIELYAPSFQLFDVEGKYYKRNYTGEWFSCDFKIEPLHESKKIAFETEYQNMISKAETEAKWQNKFIATVEINTKIYSVPCNRIESTGNQTLIWGVVNGFNNAENVIIMAVPSTYLVFIDPNELKK